jgi:hypothetical protein
MLLVSASSKSQELVFGESTYQPTCSKSEWADFGAWLVQVADARKPDDMVALARTYLCGNGDAANRAAQRSMPKVVRHVASGSGEEDLIERRSRDEFEVRGGEFWNASVEKEDQDVWVSGLVNEACGHSVRFRYVASSWLLVEFRDACD